MLLFNRYEKLFSPVIFLFGGFRLKKEFFIGLKNGIAIALGYFAVSFSFGILAVSSGLSVFQAVLISMTNVTSAGQFAGLTVIISNGGFAEMAISQLVINMRYALMSMSLSQKLADNVGIVKRCIMAFTNTDEIFAVASGRGVRVTMPYMIGVSSVSWLGWSGGTLVGAIAGAVLPQILCNALGVALYAMLISIVMPVFRDKKSVKIVVFISMAMSIGFTYLPVLKNISAGFVIVICTVIASALGAFLFPIEREDE